MVRVARFSAGGSVGFGLVEGPPDADPSELDLAVIAAHPFGEIVLTGERHRLPDVRLLAPVLPSKVVCVGKNYAAHAAEMGGAAPERPLLFLKPSTSVCGPGDAVQRPTSVQRLDHEAELAVVIGRLCRDVPEERALDVVLGYTCANDVTARDQQRTDGQWTRAKGYDTFCPLGPWVETDVRPDALTVTCTVGGEVRQRGSTADLIHTVPALIAYVSRVMTLLPGDVLLTGTPEGVGPVVAGDEMTVTISGIGRLTNPVVDRA